MCNKEARGGSGLCSRGPCASLFGTPEMVLLGEGLCCSQPMVRPKSLTQCLLKLAIDLLTSALHLLAQELLPTMHVLYIFLCV
jgi:hypothetical protein